MTHQPLEPLDLFCGWHDRAELYWVAADLYTAKHVSSILERATDEQQASKHLALSGPERRIHQVGTDLRARCKSSDCCDSYERALYELGFTSRVPSSIGIQE